MDTGLRASAIKTTQLTRRYGSTQALDAVNLEFAGQGVTAVLGANGAGKSTLVHCALGLIKPSAGHIEVFGSRAGSLHNRRRTGAMLQDADLPDLLTPREHLELFASYYPDPLPVDHLLELCEIHAFANTRYKKLSGGQKRRVQFALAIVGQPELIFLDEPTTGLDIDARRVMWKVVRTLADNGKTILLTTHYLEEADALADRIIVMHKGQVIADAPANVIRETVGGALIRCVTTMPDSALARLPAVTSVRHTGRFAELMSHDASDTLKTLLNTDTDVSELTVKKPNLEEAFLAITQEQEQEQVPAVSGAAS